MSKLYFIEVLLGTVEEDTLIEHKLLALGPLSNQPSLSELFLSAASCDVLISSSGRISDYQGFVQTNNELLGVSTYLYF